MLLDLVEIARQHAVTKAIRATRGRDLYRDYGGDTEDLLAGQGELWTWLRQVVDRDRIKLIRAFTIAGLREDAGRRTGALKSRRVAYGL